LSADANAYSAVIARLDRAIQYSEAAVIESIGCGVLDCPPSRAMTAEFHQPGLLAI
jgi:hypothetical protein